jgi:hypothetical protein
MLGPLKPRVSRPPRFWLERQHLLLHVHSLLLQRVIQLLVWHQVPDLVLPNYIAIQLQEVVNQGLSRHVWLEERLIVRIIGLGEKDLLSKPLIQLLVTVNLWLKVHNLFFNRWILVVPCPSVEGPKDVKDNACWKRDGLTEIKHVPELFLEAELRVKPLPMEMC